MPGPAGTSYIGTSGPKSLFIVVKVHGTQTLNPKPFDVQGLSGEFRAVEVQLHLEHADQSVLLPLQRGLAGGAAAL